MGLRAFMSKITENVKIAAKDIMVPTTMATAKTDVTKSSPLCPILDVKERSQRAKNMRNMGVINMKIFASLLALALTTGHASPATQLYDVNKREVEGDHYFSSPYGTQEQYFLNASPEQGQYFREPTGKRTGYYNVPRGQTTYQKGHYEKGRFYVQPNTPYPGDKPHQEYQPSRE